MSTNISSCPLCHGKNSLCKYTERPIGALESSPKTQFEFDITNELPENILLNIFSFLNCSELLMLRQISLKCRRVAEDIYLWRSVDLSCKRIHKNSVIFKLPAKIGKKVKLVNLMWSQLSFAAFRRMKQIFVSIEVLLMQHCQFTNEIEIESEIPIPDKIKIFDIRNIHTRFFEEINALYTLLNIEALAVSQTAPSDWLMRISMVWMPKLRIFHVQNNPSLSDTFIEYLTRNCPSLEALCIPGCMYIKGSFLSTIVKRLPNLKTLDMNGTRLDSVNIRGVDWSQTKIESLNISFCCKIVSYDIEYILTNMTSLKYLSASFVGWGKAITDEVFVNVIRKTTLSIQTLDLQSTFNLTTSGIAELCARTKCLRELRIGTLAKSSADLTKLLKCTPKLESLSLQIADSTLTSGCIFRALSESCPYLKTLYVYNMSIEKHESKKYLQKLYSSCCYLRNVFTGGFPQRQKAKVDRIIQNTAHSMGRYINCDLPVKIISPPKICFDHNLCTTANSKYYQAYSLDNTIEKSINSQSFYRTTLQRIAI